MHGERTQNSKGPLQLCEALEAAQIGVTGFDFRSLSKSSRCPWSGRNGNGPVTVLRSASTSSANTSTIGALPSKTAPSKKLRFA